MWPLAFITLCNIFGIDSANFRKYSGSKVGAKELFTPYKSREHIYKSNVLSDLLRKLMFCHVAFGFYNIMQFIWHGFYKLPKIFCIYRDPQLHQDFL